MRLCISLWNLKIRPVSRIFQNNKDLQQTSFAKTCSITEVILGVICIIFPLVTNQEKRYQLITLSPK